MEYDLKASDLFDCFAEDDDLELKAMFGAPRLQSGMSDSSTESSLAPSPSLLSSNLTYSTSDVLSEVKAYCRFTHELVRLQFPWTRTAGNIVTISVAHRSIVGTIVAFSTWWYVTARA